MPRNKSIRVQPSGRRVTIHRERFKDAWETGIEITGASHPEERKEFERRKKELEERKVKPEPEPLQSAQVEPIETKPDVLNIEFPDEIEVEPSTPRGRRNA